ncbi:DUF692 domain-containing protein [Pelagibius marinus]|uniref:DUF692 domain-containing protein n=1 Tax=Pelagibius marinus TaxID=2762760 RepID=UPI001873130A|nr:DUF692 family multinuclear iron-containing protein [Pelagibius marinus]
MIYTPALRSFLQPRIDRLGVLEVEPQTMWLAEDAIDGPFRENFDFIEAIAALPVAKLVHSVGAPLGGTRRPNPDQIALIRATADRLDSPWVSEHLSVAGTPHRSAGFLLPPLQTPEGVETAAKNIRIFAEGIGRPVAIETGVSYVGRKPFEMADGEFVAAVAETADCGILLDLHNVYCNERNGRTTLDTYVEALPLDRVWEIHLAGGNEAEGVWLDAHCGQMPPDLAVRARDIIRALPNLGAVNYEIYETFLADMPESTLEAILDELEDLWGEAGRASTASSGEAERRPSPPPDIAERPSPSAWEEGMTQAVWQGTPDCHPFPDDTAAIRLYARLARSFRGSMMLRVLSRSLRYLILREADRGDAILERYFKAVSPKLYAHLEAKAFRDWVTQAGEADPLLEALMDYDIVMVEMLADPRPREVRFPGDPRPVFEALAASQLPKFPEPPAWEIEILPDQGQTSAFRGIDSGS